MFDKLVDIYGDLSDSIIEEITYAYSKGKEISSIQMKLTAYNSHKNKKDKLVIVLKGIKGFILKEIKSTNQVVFEAVIIKIDNQIVFDFSPYSSYNYDINDFNKTDLGVICTSVDFFNS